MGASLACRPHDRARLVKLCEEDLAESRRAKKEKRKRRASERLAKKRKESRVGDDGGGGLKISTIPNRLPRSVDNAGEAVPLRTSNEPVSPATRKLPRSAIESSVPRPPPFEGPHRQRVTVTAATAASVPSVSSELQGTSLSTPISVEGTNNASSATPPRMRVLIVVGRTITQKRAATFRDRLREEWEEGMVEIVRRGNRVRGLPRAPLLAVPSSPSRKAQPVLLIVVDKDYSNDDVRDILRETGPRLEQHVFEHGSARVCSQHLIVETLKEKKKSAGCAWVVRQLASTKHDRDFTAIDASSCTKPAWTASQEDARLDADFERSMKGSVSHRLSNQAKQQRRGSSFRSPDSSPIHTYRHGGTRGNEASLRSPQALPLYHLHRGPPSKRERTSEDGAKVFSPTEAPNVGSFSSTPENGSEMASGESESSDPSAQDSLQRLPGSGQKRERAFLACQQSGSILPPNPDNQYIVLCLTNIAESYSTSRFRNEDRFRANGYKKLAARVSRFPERLACAEQLLEKDVDATGQRRSFRPRTISPKMLARVNEIIRSGTSAVLTTLQNLPYQAAVRELSNVHGFGAVKALQLARSGISSVAELRRRMNSLGPDATPLPFELNHAQRVGIARYEDLLVRMPRYEVAAIALEVGNAAKVLCPGIEVVVCGSFRRGKQQSGDVDILLAPPPQVEDFCDANFTFPRSTESHDQHFLLRHLINTLSERGLVTDSLTEHHYRPCPRGGKASYMGVCRLTEDQLRKAQSNHCEHGSNHQEEEEEEEEGEGGEEEEEEEVSDDETRICRSRLNSSPQISSSSSNRIIPRHRRIDIKLYSRKAFPFAILYFTGSGHFNRSMRLWAKKYGLQLNDDGLYPRSGNERRSARSSLEVLSCSSCPVGGYSCANEEDIFHALGLDYRSPEERNCFDVEPIEVAGNFSDTAEAAEAHRRQKRHRK